MVDAGTINALINLGAAGAVIIVVILFLKSNEKRDQQWQDFFTGLNKGSQARLDGMSHVTDKIQNDLEKLIEYLAKHDGQAFEIKNLILELRKDIDRMVQKCAK